MSRWLTNGILAVIGLWFNSWTSVVIANKVPVLDYSSSQPESEMMASRGTTTNKPHRVATEHNTLVLPTPMVEPLLKSRLDKLEHQLAHLNQQYSQEKVEELRTIVERLNGQLELQHHEIEQLKKQLKDFYQDINRRLGTQAEANQPKQATTTAVSTLAKDKALLQEQQLYQSAIDLLPNKKQESEALLREYIKKYPNGLYRSNSHYWLGELNFIQKNFELAETEFNTVINNYPKSKRVPDAIFKRAMLYQQQGKDKKAKEEFQRLVKLYPKSSAAQLAKQQLVNE